MSIISGIKVGIIEVVDKTYNCVAIIILTIMLSCQQGPCRKMDFITLQLLLYYSYNCKIRAACSATLHVSNSNMVILLRDWFCPLVERFCKIVLTYHFSERILAMCWWEKGFIVWLKVISVTTKIQHSLGGKLVILIRFRSTKLLNFILPIIKKA